MTTVEVRDVVIWFAHISDVPTANKLKRYSPGQRLRLKVAGRIGIWERMKDGAAGHPTAGIKPVGETKEFWAKLQDLRGAHVDFELLGAVDDEVARDELHAVAPLMHEWSSAEDEAAFRDL